jgi:hypothetical protein
VDKCTKWQFNPGLAAPRQSALIFPAFITWIGAEKALMPANEPHLRMNGSATASVRAAADGAPTAGETPDGTGAAG